MDLEKLTATDAYRLARALRLSTSVVAEAVLRTVDEGGHGDAERPAH